MLEKEERLQESQKRRSYFREDVNKNAEILAENCEVIQVDESIFSQKTYKKSEWSSVNKNCNDGHIWRPKKFKREK